MNVRLKILCEQNYIGRKYDGSYKLSGKPAIYHLLPEGIKILKQRPADFNLAILRNLARDKNARDRFINHCLGVFTIANQLKQVHGEGLKFFTPSYLKLEKFDYFPQPVPAAFITIQTDKPRHFFLEYFESVIPFFVIKKRIKYYTEYFEDEQWPKPKSPALLFICDSDDLRQKVQVETEKAVDGSWKEIAYTITTIKDLARVTLKP